MPFFLATVAISGVANSSRFRSSMRALPICAAPSEQQLKSESRLLFAVAARTTARTVLILFAVTAATGAVLHYLGT